MNRCISFLYYMMFCTDLAHIFYIFGKAVETMSIHFFCNTKRTGVNYCVMLYLMHFLANSYRFV